MRVTFLGSGDAFGSGGRFQACILVEAAGRRLLLDCGASSLIAMKRQPIDPNSVEAVLVSHLHGDHFGGIPFLVLDAQLVSRRSAPLVLAGPPGLGRRVVDAMEALFPGSSAAPRRFPLDVVELDAGRPHALGGLVVTPFEVDHASGAPPFAYRLEADGKVLAYSGDTAWTDALVAAARGADLFIAEAYFYEKRVKYHLDFRTLEAHLAEIGARRIVLTHMSDDMLARAATLGLECAADGLALQV